MRRDVSQHLRSSRVCQSCVKDEWKVNNHEHPINMGLEAFSIDFADPLSQTRTRA